MKTLFALLAMAAMASMVLVTAGPTKKRMIDPCTPFIVGSLDSDSAVNLLIPYIHSGMTVNACVTVCTGAASAALGPFGITSAMLCEPLCECALAKLDQVFGPPIYS